MLFARVGCMDYRSPGRYYLGVGCGMGVQGFRIRIGAWGVTLLLRND